MIGLFSGVYRLTSDWNSPGRQLLVSQICWRSRIIVDTVQELIILWYDFFYGKLYHFVINLLVRKAQHGWNHFFSLLLVFLFIYSQENSYNI